ncbi:hypothetical protein GQ53DRAFT_846227 [Thozetella sp. PMI_491]|nr:hypothetical protein GQ53DRAFT_846227 [Thozetella sp. PMI_491]
MPSLTRDEPSLVASPTSKKRRRDDGDNYTSLYAVALDHHNPMLVPTDRLSPRAPAAAIHGATSINHNILDHHLDGAAGHVGVGLNLGVAARKILPLNSAAKRQRTLAAVDVKDHAVRWPATIPRPAPPPMTASQYKRNHCHICGRRPRVLADLDAYADCQGCGNRTCYVCIRQCLGWSDEQAEEHGRRHAAAEHDKAMHDDTAPEEEQEDRKHEHREKTGGQQDNDMYDISQSSAGCQEATATVRDPPAGGPGKDQEGMWWGGHRTMICSRCCIEKGADGDVVCLGCLPFV